MVSSEKPQPPRIRVLRFLTIPAGEDTWEKVEYQVDADLPLGYTVEDGLKELQQPLDRLLQEFREKIGAAGKSVSPTVTPQPQVTGPPPPLPPGYHPATAEPEPELDPSFLDKLPWQAYASGVGAWVFSNLEEAKRLNDELTKLAKPIVIGNHRYRFSGDQNRFISRYPVKKP